MDFENLRLLICTRTNVAPRRLVAPGPDDAQLTALVSLAAAAPDHGQLAPWRFIHVPDAARGRLAEAFAQALLERDAGAMPEEVSQAREKAYRSPTLLIAIVRESGENEPKTQTEIPPIERIVSLGAAIQNILLGAQAMGFGAGLTSGRAMDSRPMSALCELEANEHAVCCINIGTVQAPRKPRENRKKPAEILRVLK
jgi:nitroreductase